MKIPLFDIDGVIFKTGGKVQNDSFTYAFKKIYGVDATKDDAEKVEGRVNNEVIYNVMKFHGLNDEEIKSKIKLATESIAQYWKDHIEETSLEILPGVRELLKKLKEKGSTIGLLSGNVEEIAWSKMTKMGLRHFFGFGAFGDSVYKRVDLVEIARQKASKVLNRDVKLDELFIIGDTPRDIKCARDGGIKAIAVSTGKYTFEELKKEKPNLLLHSLEDQKPILDFIS